MDHKSSNQSLRNLPQINLPENDCDSTRNHKYYQENKMDNSDFDEDDHMILTHDDSLEGKYERNSFKTEMKLRSSSMVSEIIDRKAIDDFARNRTGSLFIPNLCVHCKLLMELGQNERYSGILTKNYSDDEELTMNSCKTTTSGSMMSSRSSSPPDSSSRSSIGNDSGSQVLTKEFGQFLQVPNWKPRASSLDSAIFNNDLGKDHGRRISFEEAINPEKHRATSVDVHFESKNVKSSTENVDDQKTKSKKSPKGRFSIISISSRQTISKVIQRLRNSRFRLQSSTSKKTNYCSQWNELSQSTEHIWYPDNSVRHRCNVVNCSDLNTFELYKCSVCKTASCFPCRMKISNTCRKTFIKLPYDENDNSKNNTGIWHHWIHKTRQKGACKSCLKNLHTQNFFLNEKSINVIQCTWCKSCYHNKSACFTNTLLTENCSMGSFNTLIIHPTLIKKRQTSENNMVL